VIGAPPSPGIQATAFASIQTGTVSGVTLVDVGGGYTTVPPLTILPNPADPNLSSIVQATASIALAGGTPTLGSIVGIICTNPGVSVASVPTLAIAGAGTGSPAATAVRLTSLVSGSVAAAGTGFAQGAVLITVGGRPTATPLYQNPATDFSQFVPRPAQAGMGIVGDSLVSIGTIFDGGMFAGTATPVVIPGGGALITASATVTITGGAYSDTIRLQPAVE
jgi:hypothetical protein